MKLPIPFSPLWEAKAGPITRQGSGLDWKENGLTRDLIDEFRVLCDGFSLTVNQRRGEIWADSRLMFKAAGAALLIWCREMTILLGTQDMNTSPAHCSCYKLGLDVDGKKVGYRIYPNTISQFGRLS